MQNVPETTSPDDGGAGTIANTALGEDAPVVTGAETSDPVEPLAFNGDLRDLPRVNAPRAGGLVGVVPQDYGPNPLSTSAVGGFDALLEQQRSVELHTFDLPGLNIPGIPLTTVVPPDTVGDVGPDHYIQAVNDSVFGIWGKTGVVVLAPTALDSLWTASGGGGGDPCASGAGDPVVLYDHLADRWMLSEFAATGNHLCIYISQTADPVAGGWFIYDFTTPGFPDYPKYGTWPDAYYVGTNEPNPTLGLYALDRVNMLSGSAATFQRMTLTDLAGFNFQMLLPADLDGPAPPPGAPGLFMRANDDELHNPGGPPDGTQDLLELYEFSVDWATPANSTLTGPFNIGVTEFDSDLCGGSRDCLPQPAPGGNLDAIAQVLMWRLQYRNFGTHQTLVGNLTVDVNGADRAGIRWFELRKSAGWGVFQEGTYAPNTGTAPFDNRWMGSAAMDVAGNIALGYSVTSATTFPSIRYTGRAAVDPPGTMPLAEVTALAGSASQTAGCGTGGTPCQRWGDYSSMNVDPVDGCTFWYTTEFATGTLWATQIINFRSPSCSTTPVDYGDAPNTGVAPALYPTTIADGGASHPCGGVFFGVACDTEADGQPNATATGDDLAGDDEDGFPSIPTFTAGTVQPLDFSWSIPAGGSNSFHEVWIDFNADGDWADAGEYAVSATPGFLAAGSWTWGGGLPITVPADAKPGPTFARSRINAAGFLGASGHSGPSAAVGEVEDHQVTIGAEVDISVTKTDNATSAIPGFDVISYDIVIANAGPSTDPVVTVTDPFPAALVNCAIINVVPTDGGVGAPLGVLARGVRLVNLNHVLSMPPGSSVNYLVSCSIKPSATGTLSNTVTAAGSVTELVPGDNTATDNNTVLVPTADISITKTDGVDLAIPGKSLTYTIAVANAGPSTDPAVVVADTFSADLSCSWTSTASGSASGFTAVGAGNLADTLYMDPGSVVTYTATCLVKAGATAPLANTATATASVLDPNGSNNSATDNDTKFPVTVGLVDTATGSWFLRNSAGGVTTFLFGNPTDLPVVGDWDGDGDETSGLYRQSDGFFYSRNSNTTGIADAACFAGNPNDIPLAGDWDGDGDDNLGLYRPAEQKFYLFTTTCAGSPLGSAQVVMTFGNPGDKPVAGDWDGDGIDEIGLHRESTGLFYWRNTLDTGNASGTIIFGDPGDRLVAGDFGIFDTKDTPAVFRPSNDTFYFRHTLTEGVADSQFIWIGAGGGWLPVAGWFGLG